MSDLLTAGEFDKFENMPVNTTSAAKDLVNCPKNPFGGAKITHRCTIFQPFAFEISFFGIVSQC